MNKKTIVRLIIGVMISMLLFGCGNKEEEKTPDSVVEKVPESTPAPTAAASPTPEGVPVITEREIKDGKMQSQGQGESPILAFFSGCLPQDWQYL